MVAGGKGFFFFEIFVHRLGTEQAFNLKVIQGEESSYFMALYFQILIYS